MNPMQRTHVAAHWRRALFACVWAGLAIHAVALGAKEPQVALPGEQVVSVLTPPKVVDVPAHPMDAALRVVRESHLSITENIRDYTCTIIRRERIKGKLRPHEFIRAKIRHEEIAGGDKDSDTADPFGVYLRFTKPSSVKGREALYVAGRNSGKVFVLRGGQRMAYLSSYIKPDSRMAMKDNRYPITDIGFKRMAERLIRSMERDAKHDECEVSFFANAKVGDRSCTRIEVVHPDKRDHFTFHRSCVFIDDEDKMPIAYASYYWPRKPGDKPRLLEEYVYTDIQLNVGLTEEDFDRRNPEYGFSRGDEADSE